MKIDEKSIPYRRAKMKVLLITSLKVRPILVGNLENMKHKQKNIISRDILAGGLNPFEKH